MKLEPLIFKGFFDKIICTLTQHEYYPDVPLRQGSNERGSLEKTGAALTSPCFPEAWTGTSAPKIIYYHSNSENLYIARSSL